MENKGLTLKEFEALESVKKIKEKYGKWFAPNGKTLIYPTGKYINIILSKQTKSEASFRTEGVGHLSYDFVRSGEISTEVIKRSVITKRKQTAVERRKGRKFLRGLYGEDKYKCLLNEKMCGQCIDCIVYGSAVGDSKGSIKSRVITDDSYSILPFQSIIKKETFNAPPENSFGMTKKDGTLSSSIQMEVPVIKPEVHYIAIQTLQDLTFDEFLYVLSNILSSKKYGASVAKIGSMNNEIVSIILSSSEIYSSLELTQKVYDKVLDTSDVNISNSIENGVINHEKVIIATKKSATELLSTLYCEKLEMEEAYITSLKELVSIINSSNLSKMIQSEVSTPEGMEQDINEDSNDNNGDSKIHQEQMFPSENKDEFVKEKISQNKTPKKSAHREPIYDQNKFFKIVYKNIFEKKAT